MHLSTIFLALTAALASGAAIEQGEPTHQLHKRGCYTGGEIWGAELNTALNQLTNFCRETPAGPRPGTFNPGQGFGRCYDIGANKRVDFNLGLISSEARYIGYNECYDGFQKEMNSCAHGGSTRYTNWQYTADVNQGPC